MKRTIVIHILMGVIDLFLVPQLSYAGVKLRADGSSDAYSLINRVFGGNAVEVPDCGHKVKHINQTKDDQLVKQVFVFLSHRDLDDDRCTNKDRQRTEIKTNSRDLVGDQGETISHSWNFKLDGGFQPSKAFTHIHQLKGVGGDHIGHPLITLTPRKGSPNTLQIIHINNEGKTTVLGATDLASFLGTWVHVQETSTYDRSNGRYSVTITKLKDNSKLFSLDKKNIDLWRDGADFIRGKWGIYRSLNDKTSLRDEKVRFDDFCVEKGSEKCD